MAKKKKDFKEKEAGELVGKFECTIDKDKACTSSDGMAVYEHQDGSHSAFCWVCESSTPNLDFNTMEHKMDESWMADEGHKEKQSYSNLPELEDVRDEYIATDNKDRKLRADVYEKYGCKMELQGDGETIDSIFYPTYRTEDHVGYRIRARFPAGHKDAGKLKNFEKGKIGDTKKGIELFGQ